MSAFSAEISRELQLCVAVWHVSFDLREKLQLELNFAFTARSLPQLGQMGEIPSRQYSLPGSFSSSSSAAAMSGSSPVITLSRLVSALWDWLKRFRNAVVTKSTRTNW